MFKDFGFLVFRSFGKSGPWINKSLSPPSDLFWWGIIVDWGPFKVLYYSSFCGLILLIEQSLHELELLIKINKNILVFLLKFSPVVFQFLFGIFNALYLFVQNLHVLLIISGDIVNRILWRNNSVLLMSSRIVNTIHTKKLLFVFTIKGNKVWVKKTLLWQLVLVTHCVKVQACTHVLLLIYQSVNVLHIFLLQQYCGFSWGTGILSVWNKSLWWIGQWLSLFAAVHVFIYLWICLFGSVFE